MKINFSLPIVCYMRYLFPLEEKKSFKSNILNVFNSRKQLEPRYWVSTIYSISNDYMGYRIITFNNNTFEESTFDFNNIQIYKSHIKTLESDWMDISILVEKQNIQISKFYHLIDSMIVECVTTHVGEDILSTETLTCSPNDSDEVSWRNLFSHDSWYCFLRDSSHNEIGHRNIYIDDKYSFVDTSYDNQLNSQFEYLRLTDNKTINDYGSLQRFINYSKIHDTDKKSQFSKGGIILNNNLSIDFHKDIRNKLKIK